MTGILSRADSGADAPDLQESRVPAIIICNAVLIVASTLGLLVRFYVRFRYLGGIGWDDALCAIGWVFAFVEILVCMLMTQYGYGRHIATIHDVNKLEMFLKLDFVTEITYLLALCAIKTSFCLFYLKIFPGHKFRIICWFLIGLLIAEATEEVILVIFQCWPVEKAWDAAQKVEGKCLQLLTFYYVSFAIRLATDLAIFTLPIPKLIQLKMTLGKRIGLIFMFSLGALVVITSIIRATYLNNFSKDHTWTLVDPLNWSSVELGVAIFIACFPSFKALVTFRFPELRRALGLSSNRTYGYPGRHEMYGHSGRRTGDRRSFKGTRSHISHGHSKLGDTSTRTQTEVEASRNDSEERIISGSPAPAGIQVTTDVSVNRLSAGPSTAGPAEHGQWPLGP